MTKLTCEIDNIIYEEEEMIHYCGGCVGQNSEEICDKLPDCSGIIWVRKEQDTISPNNNVIYNILQCLKIDMATMQQNINKIETILYG